MKKTFFILAFLLCASFVFAQTNTPLTSDSDSNKIFPKWSPDDSLILYVDDNLTAGSGNTTIRIISSAGGAYTELTNDTVSSDFPEWSNDGQWAVFQMMSAGNYLIYKINVSQPYSEINLTTGTVFNYTRPQFSPDDSTVVCSIDDETSTCNAALRYCAQIATLNSAGGGVQNITTERCDHLYPRWNYAGTKIAYAKTCYIPGNASWSNWIIAVVNASGGAETNLTNGWDGDDRINPQWSPDDSEIVYQRKNGSSTYYELWKVPAAGGAEVYLASGPNNDLVEPHWSPDGATIIYTDVDWFLSTSDIYTVPSAGGSVTALIAGGILNYGPPMYDSTGTMVIYTKIDGTGFMQLYEYGPGSPCPVPEFSSFTLLLTVLAGLGIVFVLRQKP